MPIRSVSRYGGLCRPPLALITALALAASPAIAKTLITKTSFSGNQTFEASAGPHLINLGEGNGAALTVNTAVPSRLVILFNAECSVAAPTNSDWLHVEILVDGVAAPPSGGDQALCTSDGDSALDNWVTAASDTAVDVGAGTHTVQLRGSLVGSGVAGDDWWIGDLSLIVIMKEL